MQKLSMLSNQIFSVKMIHQAKMGGSLKEFIINTEAGLVLIAAMIVATAFFVAAEFSLVASNRKKIEEEVANGLRSSRVVLE